ncbi:uncharacterized protein LTR77_000325 [Saxophila tyrrhenica]|uniref:Glycosyltransferase family 31 protein n=1 Tax=Saxophila tyrrhenica TaxID=1690608 RepID=A0AAV9PPI2_9PEZI|nr:hypothetical protein LTR77_000325 [Saxophila tyrrhenica]
MLQGYPSKSRAATVAAAVLLLLLGAHVLRSHAPPVPRWRLADGEAVIGGHVDIKDDPETLPCQKLPGAEDVVVIMRTGATEIQDKLPIHFNTTFRCYRDVLIFSDYAETFQGHEVHDALAAMDQDLKENNPDFELYMRLQRHGRESLSEDELSGKASFEGSKSGKGENPGWKLDKWKFLPMMNETLNLRPDKKWFMFVESDSYPVWSNMLQWLENVDPAKPHYFGSEVMIGPDIFAHGGSVFVMSKPAIELGAQYYAERRQEWDLFTDGHWAGDCVLGKELGEAGAPLEWSWPMFQGGHPEKMDFTEKKHNDRKLWCVPALSYHHFSPTELPRFWEFEQMWIQSRLDKVSAKDSRERRWSFWEDYSDVLEHRDVFREFVWPRIREGQAGFWNNLSPNIVENTAGSSEDNCRRICEETPDCLQYASGREGCSMSNQQVMLGEKQDGYKSGWMLDRIEGWVAGLDNCAGFEGWTVS